MNGRLRIQNELKSRIEVNCNLCGHNEGWTVYKKDGVIDDHKVWCKKCGLIYKKFIWSEEDNNKFYNEYYLNDYMDWSKDGTNGRKTHFQMGKRRKHQISKISNILKGAKRPMEFGCSSGGVLSELVKFNKNIIGIDIDDESLRYAQKMGLPAKRMDLFKIKSKFDFVWSSHVFEHLTDVRPFIKKIDEITTPDAKLVLLVPNSLKMPEGPTVPHIFNFSLDTFRSIIEINSSFRFEKQIRDKKDLFLVFSKSANRDAFICKTSFDAYESHLKNIENLFRNIEIRNLRNSYDSSKKQSERRLISKKFKTFKKVSFTQKLFWSKLYRFFTLKWI